MYKTKDQIDKQTVSVLVYTVFYAQSVTSDESDAPDWAFLSTDHGNIWFNPKRDLIDITIGEVNTLTVYKYKPGTHNARTGLRNMNFNVCLDNVHLS